MLRPRGEQLGGEAGIPAVPQDSAGLLHAGPGCVPVAQVLEDSGPRQERVRHLKPSGAPLGEDDRAARILAGPGGLAALAEDLGRRQ